MTLVVMMMMMMMMMVLTCPTMEMRMLSRTMGQKMMKSVRMI
jgi:hypothetical protein